MTGRSAARLARLLWEQEVGGSNPLAPIVVNVLSSRFYVIPIFLLNHIFIGYNL